MKKATLSIAMLLLVTLCTTFAGPFGLEMGMSRAEIRKVADIVSDFGDSGILIILPYQSHPAFEDFMISVAPKEGLYFINITGKKIDISQSETELLITFSDVLSGLIKVYGEPTYQSMGDYIAAWDTDDGTSLPNNVASILLWASNTDKSQGDLYLSYTFTNADHARADIEKATVF